MPEMDGIQATEYLRRELPPHRQPIIVAVTADAFEENKKKCLEAGMDEVVTKPILRNRLLEIFTKYFQPLSLHVPRSHSTNCN